MMNFYQRVVLWVTLSVFFLIMCSTYYVHEIRTYDSPVVDYKPVLTLANNINDIIIDNDNANNDNNNINNNDNNVNNNDNNNINNDNSNTNNNNNDNNANNNNNKGVQAGGPNQDIRRPGGMERHKPVQEAVAEQAQKFDIIHQDLLDDDKKPENNGPLYQNQEEEHDEDTVLERKTILLGHNLGNYVEEPDEEELKEKERQKQQELEQQQKQQQQLEEQRRKQQQQQQQQQEKQQQKQQQQPQQQPKHQEEEHELKKPEEEQKRKPADDDKQHQSAKSSHKHHHHKDRDTDRKKVVIVENNGWHDEVIAPILYTVSKITPVVRLEYHAMRFGIEQVYQYLVPNNQTTLYVKKKYHFNPTVDVLVLVTCERDYVRHNRTLLRHLTNTTTHIVCLVHHMDQWQGELGISIKPFIDAKRVTFMAISPHTYNFLRGVLPTAHIEWFAPVFPVNIAPTYKKSNKVALQGKYDPTRRSYDQFFDTLQDMHRTHNITVDLLGSGTEAPAIPDAVKSMVKIKQHLQYVSYYRVLSESLAILTAFASPKYFTDTASSTIPAALIAGTPLVANSTLLNAYSYLNDDVVWRAKDGEDELACVARLLDTGEVVKLNEKRRNIEALRTKLYKDNEAIWRRIIEHHGE